MSDEAPPDDFAKAPQTIMELRAWRKQDSSLWAPRDMLVALLRDIDAGTLVPTNMVVVFCPGPNEGISYRVAGDQSRFETVGMLSYLQFRFNQDSVPDE